MNGVEGNSTEKVITKSGQSQSQSWSLDGVIVKDDLASAYVLHPLDP